MRAAKEESYLELLPRACCEFSPSRKARSHILRVHSLSYFMRGEPMSGLGVWWGVLLKRCCRLSRTLTDAVQSG
eukprot:4011899-Amphidinium_carterae.1